MGIIWTPYGAQAALTAWQAMDDDRLIRVDLRLPLALLELGALADALQAECDAVMRAEGHSGRRRGAIAIFTPDEPDLPALVLHERPAGLRLGLMERPASPDAPPPAPDRIDWLPAGAHEADLARAWGRHLSVRSGWRLALIDAEQHATHPRCQPLARDLDALTIALSHRQVQLLAEAMDDEDAAVGAIGALTERLGLDDPLITALSETPDLCVAGLLSSAAPSGGYRTWVGPHARPLEDGHLLALAVARREELRALVPPDEGPIPHAITPEQILVAATREGITPAEAAALRAHRHAVRAPVVRAAAAQARSVLGASCAVEVHALDHMEVTRGGRSLQVNIDAVLQKIDDDVEGPAFAAQLRAMARSLAADGDILGMIDPARAWYAMHLRPHDPDAATSLALVEETSDEAGNRFQLVATLEDEQAVLPIPAGRADLTPAVVRDRVRRDRPRLRLDAEAHPIAGVLGEVVGFALIGSNIATALALPTLRAALHEEFQRATPGDGPLIGLGISTGCAVVTRPDGADVAITAADGIITDLGPRAGALLGYLAVLGAGDVSDAARGCLRLAYPVPEE